jgi:hypothetical protein
MTAPTSWLAETKPAPGWSRPTGPARFSVLMPRSTPVINTDVGPRDAADTVRLAR